jgi:hypothetical protein
MKRGGYVYLVIPPELKGTNRAKIGMSLINNNNRIKSYGKNVEVIMQYSCKNARILEKTIIESFKKHFKVIKGNEYFEGEIEEMKKIFINKITEDDSDSEDEYDNSEVVKEFSNWYDDKTYGGNKYLVKITVTHYKCVIFTTIIDKESTDEYIIDLRCDEYIKDYIEKLFEKKVIEHGKVYDLNSKKFINKVDRYKKKINLTICPETQKSISKKSLHDFNNNQPEMLFTNNAIINKSMYCCELVSEYTGKKYLNISNHSFSINIRMIKIRGILYDTNYLRRFLPYIIEIYNDSEFYTLNRDYEYMGLGTKNIDTDKTYCKRIYLFNDGNPPWCSDKYFIEYVGRLHKLVKNKICLNMQENTSKIILL